MYVIGTWLGCVFLWITMLLLGYKATKLPLMGVLETLFNATEVRMYNTWKGFEVIDQAKIRNPELISFIRVYIIF
jgi:hypothetical protein